MTSKSINLLIDGFLAYYTRLNLLQTEFLQGLTNIKVIFLPTNTIFVCQLLNQEIIKA